MLKSLIEQLSKQLKTSLPLAPNEEGSYSLTFEPNIEILLRENDSSGITLVTTLAPFPSKNASFFLQKLMSANLLGKETARAALGLDREEKEVTFTSFLSESLPYKRFYHSLEEFVNYAEAWRKEISQFNEES